MEQLNVKDALKEIKTREGVDRLYEGKKVIQKVIFLNFLKHQFIKT
jgi:hypothetical protein